MKLTFIGTGSAFTVGHHNYHSNMLLENQGQRLLIDCGSDARLALHELGLSQHDIQAVYVSHLHADHVGGLEWLAFSKKFNSHPEKAALYVNEVLAKELWDKVLAGGLNSLQGAEASLSTYFDVHALAENASFTWQKSKFDLIKTVHVVSGFSVAPSYGLFITGNKKVFLTTDTQFRPDYYALQYEQADLIFHDCETSEQHSGVHSHFSELCTLDPAIKKKMWLYHYNQDKPLPDAKSQGFLGFVQKGQVFEV